VLPGGVSHVTDAGGICCGACQQSGQHRTRESGQGVVKDEHLARLGQLLQGLRGMGELRREEVLCRKQRNLCARRLGGAWVVGNWPTAHAWLAQAAFSPRGSSRTVWCRGVLS